jgi:hypothetical protein
MARVILGGPLLSLLLLLVTPVANSLCDDPTIRLKRLAERVRMWRSRKPPAPHADAKPEAAAS